MNPQIEHIKRLNYSIKAFDVFVGYSLRGGHGYGAGKLGCQSDEIMIVSMSYDGRPPSVLVHVKRLTRVISVHNDKPDQLYHNQIFLFYWQA